MFDALTRVELRVGAHDGRVHNFIRVVDKIGCHSHLLSGIGDCTVGLLVWLLEFIQVVGDHSTGAVEILICIVAPIAVDGGLLLCQFFQGLRQFEASLELVPALVLCIVVL